MLDGRDVLCFLPAEFAFPPDRQPLPLDGSSPILRDIAAHDIDLLFKECRSRGSGSMILTRFACPRSSTWLDDLGITVSDMSLDYDYLLSHSGQPQELDPAKWGQTSVHWTFSFRFAHLEQFVQIAPESSPLITENIPDYLHPTFIKDHVRSGWSMFPKPGFNWVGKGHVAVDDGKPKLMNLIWFREDCLNFFLRRCWLTHAELMDIRVCSGSGGASLQDYVLGIPRSKANDYIRSLKTLSTGDITCLIQFLKPKMIARTEYQTSGRSKSTPTLLNILMAAVQKLEEEIDRRALCK